MDPDHLNTPRLITNQAQQAVWRYDNTEPFADSVPDENPAGLGAFEFPLRFPGQYADKESGLSYNLMRSYDARIGRYVEADLVGTVLFRGMGFNNLGSVGAARPELAAQLFRLVPQQNHLYAYAGSSPLTATDPTGLLVPPPGTPIGRHCIKVAEYVVSRTPDGPIGGWPPTVLVQCVYYCPPEGTCPPNPEDYYYSKFLEGPEFIPNLPYPRCPMFGTVGDIFPGSE